MQLEGKVVIVTGGTKGIGRAIAVGAAKEGAKVVVAGRNSADATAVEEEIRQGGNGDFLFVQGDLTDVSHCENLVEQAVKRFGKLDGLVNYAGTVQSMAPLTDTTEDQFQFIMNTNFKSAFFVTKYALRAMRENGSGSIINMGSMHAYGGEADRAAYACSKGAMLTLFKHVAKNYAKEMIRCNWITIGWVATPGELSLRQKEQGVGNDWLDKVGADFFPMKRLQTPEDYVASAIYLLSDGSSQVTGSELLVTGGFMF